MKTSKHSVLFVATTMATSFAFAQSGLGITQSANAALNASVRTAAAQAVTSAAVNAATKASLQATANATHTLAATSAQAKAATTAQTKALVTTTNNTITNTKADVGGALKANAGINAHHTTHASGNADANGHAASLHTGAATQTNVLVAADGSKAIDAGVQQIDALEKQVSATATNTINAAGKAQTKLESDIAAKTEQTLHTSAALQSDMNAKGEGAANASGNTAKQTSNHSVNAKTKTAASGNIQAAPNDAKAGAAMESSAVVKATKQ